MAPRRKTAHSYSQPPSQQFPIGNCDVTIDAKNFTCQSIPNAIEIRVARTAKITVSVKEEENKKCDTEDPSLNCDPYGEYSFLLINPKDGDGSSKKYMEDVIKLYKKELPAMKFAANTGKKSRFLENSVLNGKYCTLLLKPKENSEEVIAAVTYQIVPADTQYAEIPLAAVSAVHQNKGIGRHMYEELRTRLQSVGICTILCWGDQDSEGFWLKQDFVAVAEVDIKGRARRLPIKPNVRKALCFPGGSTLMISHLKKNYLANTEEISKVGSALNPHDNHALGTSEMRITTTDNSEPKEGEVNGSQDLRLKPVHGCDNSVCYQVVSAGEIPSTVSDGCLKPCSNSSQGAKRRAWEASVSSLNSKKVKGTHTKSCYSESNWNIASLCDKNCSDFLVSSVRPEENKVLAASTPEHSSKYTYFEKNFGNCSQVENYSEVLVRKELEPREESIRIMLMNIADDNKKAHLTKVIEDLGGSVCTDGSKSTHVVTGQARKTLNFCTALSLGAWIVSSSWLKESVRQGKFVDETPYLLKDEEYASKYRAELRLAVLRARDKPGSLLKGYDLCIAAHVVPPRNTLATIAMAAGGNILHQLEEAHDVSKTIFVASEEDMKEALLAIKNGIRTFGSDWLMNCIMRQELDLQAPQYAESL